MTSKKRGLGKGLEALLGTSQVARQKQILSDIQADAVQHKVDDQKGELQILPVSWLRPGKYQPRRDMSQEALEDLANSIRAQGVIQPIVVRQIAEQQFEIIAGERRWRASQLVRLETVPCLIKNVEDNAAVAIALIENIQREDLNAIEEAVALQRLMTEFELSHQQVAEAVGKSRSAVSNLLRLNQLNDDVKQLVEHGDLDMGHARALLSLEGELQSDAARTVAQKNLTVRDTEKMVQKLLNPPSPKPERQVDEEGLAWSESLSDKLGVSVQIIRSNDDNGKIVLTYKSYSEFEKIRHFFNLS
ncbi:ParB/RepB/Spo0J family partition protein [Tolumonas lignilytica]|uniref:ParB/RepB/Spo0J family partition protein n=1 Tax=Tolumonas lignilytica TaxID=1283284 RepID=UPI000467E1FD|nr:ParB/RepB/Spo0J family partition protein [Tolumonas lignilytica]